MLERLQQALLLLADGIIWPGHSANQGISGVSMWMGPWWQVVPTQEMQLQPVDILVVEGVHFLLTDTLTILRFTTTPAPQSRFIMIIKIRTGRWWAIPNLWQENSARHYSLIQAAIT